MIQKYYCLVFPIGKSSFYLETGDKPTLDPITYYLSVRELDETPPYKINNKIAYSIKVLSTFFLFYQFFNLIVVINLYYFHTLIYPKVSYLQ